MFVRYLSSRNLPLRVSALGLSRRMTEMHDDRDIDHPDSQLEGLFGLLGWRGKQQDLSKSGACSWVRAHRLLQRSHVGPAHSRLALNRAWP